MKLTVQHWPDCELHSLSAVGGALSHLYGASVTVTTAGVHTTACLTHWGCWRGSWQSAAEPGCVSWEWVPSGRQGCWPGQRSWTGAQTSCCPRLLCWTYEERSDDLTNATLNPEKLPVATFMIILALTDIAHIFPLFLSQAIATAITSGTLPSSLCTVIGITIIVLGS